MKCMHGALINLSSNVSELKFCDKRCRIAQERETRAKLKKEKEEVSVPLLREQISGLR